MRVLFWVPYPSEGASNRYRVEQYLPYLHNVKIQYSLHPFWSSAAFKVLYKEGFYLKKIYFFILGTISRVLDLLLIYKYDCVFIHREAYPIGFTFFETILSILSKPIIYDFDDAIFLPSSSRPNIFIDRFKNPSKIKKIIRMSNCIIAGNQYLADFALKDNKEVSVIPTSIDTEKYAPVHNFYIKERKKVPVVIGWIGSVTTSEFLNIIKNPFIQLSRSFAHVIFKIIGSDFSIDAVAGIVNHHWSLATEVDDLRTFDIGIMPMPDNDWTRGKCGFKAILYMSMGIPCVSSPVGVNKEIMRDGINGFLAESERDWIEKLSLLIENPELRKKIGLQGRETIEQLYSVKVNASKFLETISKVCLYNKEIY